MAAFIKLSVVLQNQYFEDSEFLENPIKTFLKPYYFSGTYNKSAYNYLLLS